MSGAWSDAEHKRFLDAIRIYGKNWPKIVEHIGTRDRAQVGSHSQKWRLDVKKNPNLDGAELVQLLEVPLIKLKGRKSVSKTPDSSEEEDVAYKWDQDDSDERRSESEQSESANEEQEDDDV